MDFEILSLPLYALSWYSKIGVNLIQILSYWDNWLLQQANSIVGYSSVFDKIVEYLGIGLVYLVPIILIGVWIYSSHTKKAALQMLFSALLPMLANRLFAKFIWFRPRPFMVQSIDIKEVIFHRPDYSFPSDHAALFAALVMAAFLLGFKKLGWWFLGIGLVVVVTRVITGVHYPLDIIGGIISGVLAALLLNWLKGPLTKYVYNPIITVAHKIHLA